MTQQTEAERLVYEHDNDEWIAGTRQWCEEAAAELRRLQAANLDCMDHFNALKADYDKQQALTDEQARAMNLTASLNEKLVGEVERLEGLVYTPGLWRCAKCSFMLVQRNLNANSGTVTARDQPGDKCPNCNVPLWRVTERENARDNYDAADGLQLELNAARAEIERLRAVPEGCKLIPVARVEFIEDSGYPSIQRIPGARLSQGDTLYLAAEKPIYQREPLTEAQVEMTTGRLPLPSLIELVRAIERAHGIGVTQ